MDGGFTKYNKLEVTDLGTEGTGDRIALFNSDGRLVGYVLKENLEGFIPLSGTEVDKPITGDFEVDGDYVTTNGFNLFTNQGDLVKRLKFADDATMELGVENTSTSKYSVLSFSDTYFNFNIGSSLYNRGISISDGVPMTLTDSDGLGFVGGSFFNKLNDPKAFAQLGDIATGFESGYTTTDQVITATTDTIITLSGASFESDGGLNLIDGTSGKITPLLQGDILSIDIAMPLLTPVGTNEYCTMTLVPFGTSNVYRAITHQFIKGAGNQDYISANWTVPIGADIITAGGLSIVINSTAGITIDSKYISVSRLHRTKN